MRLVTIYDGSKWIIFASGGLQLLLMVSELDTGWCASGEVGPLRGWIMRSHIGWEGNEAFLICECGNFSLVDCFKIVRLMVIRNGSKWTIFASSEFRLLQMISELDTSWCASGDIGSLREVDCEIPYWLGGERRIPYM